MCVATAGAVIAITNAGVAACAAYHQNPVNYKCDYCGSQYKTFMTNCKNCGGVINKTKTYDPIISEKALQRSRAKRDTSGVNPMGQGDIVSEGSTGTVFPRSSDVSGSYGDSTPSYDTGIPECHVPHHQEESQTTGGSFGLTPDASTTIESPSPTTET